MTKIRLAVSQKPSTPEVHPWLLYLALITLAAIFAHLVYPG